MTNAERKVRLNVATEIIERVHSDLCNDHTEQVSRETTYELADIIRQLLYFTASLSGAASETGDTEEYLCMPMTHSCRSNWLKTIQSFLRCVPVTIMSITWSCSIWRN